MTAPAVPVPVTPRTRHSPRNTRTQRVHCGGVPREMSFQKSHGMPIRSCTPIRPGSRLVPILSEDELLEWFVDLLWRAFPDARSSAHLSRIAADALTTKNRKVEPRTVSNWLCRRNTPHFRYVFVVLGLAGVECVFRFFEPEA